MLDLEVKQMKTEIATKLIEDSIKIAWEKVCQFFKDKNNELSIDYGYAYEQYLRNTFNKNSKIKTIIYRRVPKDLYSFYECIGVLNDNTIINTDDVNNLLSVDNKIIITGTGGIGKSILFKHLFLNSILKTSFIPVLIELRAFNSIEENDLSLKQVIYNNLSDNGFSLEEKYFDYSIEKGGYIILLDGFDEVNRDKTERVSSEIRSFCNKYNNNKFIISSRPSDIFIGWNDFVEMTAMSLTKEQALSLIKKIEFDETIKSVFYEELKNNLYEKYNSFASNPLLLNIMLLTFNNHASIPDKLNDFYEQAFSTLFNMHDATKDAYVRDIRTGLGCEDFKSVFSYICFKSYFADQYEFTTSELHDYISKAKQKFEKLQFEVDDYLEDLTSSVCMLIKEGLKYRFSHRSFQEYFAALYTCKLTDAIQKSVLTSWLKESNSIVTDSYFKMLFNLQGEKVNKIVLAPGLKEIKKLYESLGFSIKLLKKLFSHIGVKTYYIFTENPKEKEKSIPQKRLSLRIKNNYLCQVLSLTCHLNSFVYADETTPDEIEAIKTIDESIKEKRITSNSFDYFAIDKIAEIVGEEALLAALSWLKNEIDFALSILDKNDKKTIKDKDVASIIKGL